MRTTETLFLVAASVLLAAGEARAQAKPPVVWVPASPSNYGGGARGQITGIVIHKVEGSASGAAGWFRNPAAGSAAHFCVADDGTIYQCVDEDTIGWHAGNWDTNVHTIGIEHGGYTANDDVSEEEYRASAQLVAYECARYGIPIDRAHIYGHDEVPDPNNWGQYGGAGHHTDPGVFWNWDHYMALVRSYAGMGGPVAPLPPPQLGARMLQLGSQGDDVRQLQDALRARGFDPGPSDGAFGPMTEQAVIAFQGANGLAVDGVVGPQTLGALLAGTPAAPPPPAAPAPPPPGGGLGSRLLQLGASGSDVSELQDLLRAHGSDPGPTDGAFGPMTDAAVRDFQARSGLAVDGVVGPQTVGALRASPAAPAPPPAAAARMLRQGDQGDDVRVLQDALRAHGFDPGPTDGDFGGWTLQAVLGFQSANGLAADGVVGPLTRAALGI